SEPIDVQKSLYITHWATCPNQKCPTDFADEALFLMDVLFFPAFFSMWMSYFFLSSTSFVANTKPPIERSASFRQSTDIQKSPLG
ncbi:hypothetical protein, partial [Endozoicomonas sp. ALB122]|uniref:hypothetical protein n=1 Tax=Endozoicomonas sp. ALB122 TaxID=3403075 RepID=UPI003BB6BAD6